MFPGMGGTQGYQPYAYAGNNPASPIDNERALAIDRAFSKS